MSITQLNLETGEITVLDQDAPSFVVLASIPQEVSRFQARAGLIKYGAQIGRPRLLQEADALVASLTGGMMGLTVQDAEIIKEAWAGAQVIRRDSPSLALLFPALGLALPDQLDELFLIAAQVVA